MAGALLQSVSNLFSFLFKTQIMRNSSFILTATKYSRITNPKIKKTRFAKAR
jgi:hypothetical protein